MAKHTILLSSALAVILSVSAAASAQAVMPAAPAGGWLFDGTLSDEFGDNHGTVVGGGITFGSGPFAGSQALDVRGTSGAVDFGNPENLQFTEAISVSFWFNTEGSGGYIFNKWDIGSSVLRSWAVRDAGNGEIAVMLSRNGFFSAGNRKEYRIPATLNDGNWHHVAFTFADDDLKVYLNGNAVDSPTLTFNDSFDTIHNNSASIFAGSRSDHPNSLFDGLIAEAGIWGNVLNGDEIAWLSQNSLAAIPEPSTYALIFGLGSLGFLLVRRKAR